jgi:phenylalanyl-tRNA synthetase beta chain
MKVTLNWLKDYVEVDSDPSELADMLTMAGLEVEELKRVGYGIDSVIAVRIDGVLPHPKADRLKICKVSAPERQFEVVCGAPNLRVGDLVPLALPGTVLPSGMEVKEAMIRGIRSTGMLLAEDELGVSDDHSGLMILPPGVQMGDVISRRLSLEDWVLEIGITPNRPDCTSVLGIAREIAALQRKRIKRPEISYVEEDARAEDLTSVRIEDPRGCRRYAAGVIRDVRPGVSPFWMRYRLHLAGVRSINSIVDVTNYVMLEMGQPLHAFDYDLLVENRIVVKRAAQGEEFQTLDGKTHSLGAEHLMICDGGRSVALAGIMGGMNSEISSQTKNVLLESAYFDPVTIRRGAKSLGISTEASYRFERGIDLENVDKALKRAMALIQAIAGGRIAKGIVDNYPSPYVAPKLRLRVEKTNRYLGTSLNGAEMADILSRLEMEVKEGGEGELWVTPPSFRVDITREVDLTEEVARIHGYNLIPVTTPAVRGSDLGREGLSVLKERVDCIMLGMGFNEVISYSFIPDQYPDLVGADQSSPLRAFVRILNPITNEQAVMRTSLFPGLMGAVKNNLSYDEKDLRLYEFGKVFIASQEGSLPKEIPCMAGVLVGLFERKTWYGEERSCDFFDMKGVVEGLLDGLGVEDTAFRRGASDPAYDPNQSVTILCGGNVLGRAGRSSPNMEKAYGFEATPIFLFDLDLEGLQGVLKREQRVKALAKFPPAYRDISIIVDKKVESGKIADIIMEEGGDIVESVRLFDLYEGKQMGPNEKAMAYRICYRSKTGTLEGATVNRVYDATIGRIIAQTGGRLREA